MKIISGTGHRELPFNEPFLIDITKRALLRAEANLILSGMAQGFDTILAEAALELGIPYKAICPFRGQGDNWPEEAKKRYQKLLTSAIEVVYTSEYYFKECFFVRDRYLVDNSDLLFAMYDGRVKGGTFYTVKYAKGKEHPMVNLWDVSVKLQKAKIEL